MSPKKKEEEAKVLDHDYDGIQELDNPLPRWWVYMFYATIVFSIFYILHYSLGPGKSIDEKFEDKIAQVTEQKETAADVTVDYSSTPERLETGKLVFDAKCSACHKTDGGGLVGPNLTDNYWIHGGSSEDIAKVIRDGVVSKGMLAWEALLKPEEITSLVVYIHALNGSNPAGAKAPEGELYDGQSH